MNVKVYNKGYDPATGIGELVVTVSLRHAWKMIHREVAEPVELAIVGDDIAPTALALTREISMAWVEDRGGVPTGFSTRAVHERDHWTCAYCGCAVSRTPKRQGQLATVDHIHPQSRGGATSWMNLVSACFGCNQRKADLSLAEAGMRLLFEPYDPAVAYRDQDGRAVLLSAPLSRHEAALVAT